MALAMLGIFVRRLASVRYQPEHALSEKGTWCSHLFCDNCRECLTHPLGSSSERSCLNRATTQKLADLNAPFPVRPPKSPLSSRESILSGFFKIGFKGIPGKPPIVEVNRWVEAKQPWELLRNGESSFFRVARFIRRSAICYKTGWWFQVIYPLHPYLAPLSISTNVYSVVETAIQESCFCWPIFCLLCSVVVWVVRFWKFQRKKPRIPNYKGS